MTSYDVVLRATRQIRETASRSRHLRHVCDAIGNRCRAPEVALAEAQKPRTAFGLLTPSFEHI